MRFSKITQNSEKKIHTSSETLTNHFYSEKKMLKIERSFILSQSKKNMIVNRPISAECKVSEYKKKELFGKFELRTA